MGLYSAGKELASLWLQKKKTDYQRSLQNVETRVDSGGRVHEYSFSGQEIDPNELRDIKEIRESGGLVAQLVHAKALMYFGTGIELSVPEEQEEEEVDEETEVDYEGIVSGTVSDAKEQLQELDDPDYEAALEAEENGKDRKTLKEWIKSRV